MKKALHSEGTEKKMYIPGSLESLVNMEWRSEVSVLADFLNHACGEAEVVNLALEMKYVLTLFESGSGEEAERVEEFLTSKMARMRNYVKIMPHLEAKKVRVYLEADSEVEEVWADFICAFLTMDNWRALLGKCPQCGRWFARSRGNQVYSRPSCRQAASNTRRRQREEARNS